jgi:hypothetical protein
MIEIKTLYGGWREVTREQALAWIKHVKNGGGRIKDKNKYINTRLRGATVEELERENERDNL